MVFASRVTYTAAPAQTAFAITFSSLSTAHFEVYVDDVLKTNPTHYTINSTRTTVTLVAPAVGGETVLIKRATPAAPLVDWVNGSSILESDLDTLYSQLRFRVEENDDDQQSTLQLLGDGTAWDADSKQIKNLADGTLAQDAVSKAQLDSAAIVAGNLPPVSGADNDKMLQVVAAAWATRTLAQIKTSLLLPTDTAAAITALQAGRPLVKCPITTANLYEDAGGTWYESASSRMALGAFDVQRANSLPYYTKTADKITITQPGDYMITLYMLLNGSTADAFTSMRVTNNTDGPTVVTHYEPSNNLSVVAADPESHYYARFKVTVSTTLDVVVRTANRVLAGNVSVSAPPSYIEIEKLAI
jgi:hypothetical protein